MSFNEDRWVKVEGSPYSEHVNKIAIDPVIQEIHAAKGGIYPKLPVKRDETGKVMLREELMSSSAITFQSTITSISEQFTKLIELLSKIKI